jgi:PKD repeat protein
MVGGLYHNGVIAYYEGWNDNEYLELGGAVLPAVIGQPVQYVTFGMSPNETYWSSASSEMEFDPRCYNLAWIGKDNALYRSSDGGASFSLVHSFGTNSASQVSYFEIAMSDPDVMYVVQRPATGNLGKLWKTVNGGSTWTQLTIPGGNSSRMVLTVSPTNKDSLWIAYPSGSNGNKVYVSGTGGSSWTNITTSALDNQEVRSLVCIGATNGGIYLATNQTVYYRNNVTATWTPDNSGLPALLQSLYLRPFYRDGKIKISSYGHGLWENDLQDMPAQPVAQPQVDKLTYTLNCVTDTFYFEDHSILNHQGASWQWAFPGGNPSSSSLRNPKVVYASPGSYNALLTVTDSQGHTDSASLTVTILAYQVNAYLAEGFESGFPPADWWLDNREGDAQWSLSTGAGGYGQSAQSALFDNFSSDSHGHSDDLRIRTDMTQQTTNWLKFDRAYAEYGFPYSDTLEVLVSTDCGATFTSLYLKGGSDLATAPSITSATFVPAAAEWITDSIDLSAWMSSADLMIVFRNHGHYGQAVYIDNINLSPMVGVAAHPAANGNAALYPNPVLQGQPLVIAGEPGETYMVEIFDAEGRFVHRAPHRDHERFLPGDGNLAPGVYYYRLSSERRIRNGTFIVGKAR